MKLIKLIFMMIGTFIIVSSCQSVKEGLSGQRKANSDEFLVKMKNPLVLPPHFGELPKPAKDDEDIDNKDDEIDLTKFFKKSDKKKKIDKSNTSLEKSILKKIGTN